MAMLGYKYCIIIRRKRCNGKIQINYVSHWDIDTEGNIKEIQIGDLERECYSLEDAKKLRQMAIDYCKTDEYYQDDIEYTINVQKIRGRLGNG